MLRLLTSVLLLVQAEGPGDYLATRSPDPPARWTASSEQPSDEQRAVVLRAAQELVGQELEVGPIADAAWVERGVFADATPFGGPGASEAWLAFLPSIAVHDAGAPKIWTPVRLHVVLDARDLRLLCAFVRQGDLWHINRESTGESLETYATTGGFRWSFADAGGAQFQSTVPEVLGGVWAATGLNPSTATFIIMRPRRVSWTYPADVVDGEPRPKDGAARLRWIVESRGTVVQTRHGFPYTVLLASVDDEDPRRSQWTTRP